MLYIFLLGYLGCLQVKFFLEVCRKSIQLFTIIKAWKILILLQLKGEGEMEEETHFLTFFSCQNYY